MQATLSPAEMLNETTIIQLPSCIPRDPDRLDCKLLALAEDLNMLMRFGYLNGLDYAAKALLEEHCMTLMDYSAEAFLAVSKEPRWRLLGRAFGRGRVR